MARKIRMPDGKIANFPDDVTDAQIAAFANKNFKQGEFTPAKKPENEGFVGFLKSLKPESMLPFKGLATELNIPKGAILTDSGIMSAEGKFLGKMEDFVTRPEETKIDPRIVGSGRALGFGLASSVPGVAGKFLSARATKKAAAAKESGRVAENAKSISLVQEKLNKAALSAKELVAKRTQAGKDLLRTLKTGTKEQRADIIGTLGVDDLGAAIKNVKDGMKNLTIEKQIENAVVELPLQEASLMKIPYGKATVDDILTAMKTDDPAALTNAINKHFKNAKDVDMTSIINKLEEVRISARGNKTLDDTVREFREDFSKALPLEARLGRGLGVAGRGREVSKTPLTGNVGAVAPEVEQAVGSVAPVTMTLSRNLRPQSVLSTEKAGTELYDLARRTESEGTSFTGRLNKIVIEEGAKYTPARREAIGRFLDGQAEILSPAEAETARQLRRVTDFIADQAKIPKERRVKDYLTRFIDIDDTGLPIDAIETLAHRFAMEEAAVGKLGRVGDDFVKSLPTLRESKSNMGQVLFSQLDEASKSNLINKAKNVMRGQPIETYYGPLSASRSAESKLVTQDFQEVLLRYIPGAYRKIGIDKLLKWNRENSSRLSPELRHYASEYIDAFRGVMGSTELMSTMAFERLAMKLEGAGASKILSGTARFLKPREFSGFVRKWQFNAKIGGNMATALVNLSQTGVNTVTEIGFIRTGKAIAEYLGGGVRVRKILEKRGITRQPHLGDINPGNIDRPTKVLSFMFQQTEEFNRGVAYLAGYNEARAVGKGIKEATRLGQKLVDDTQFVFSKSNVPINMQDPYMAIVFQFKNYLWNQLQFIKRVTTNAHKEPAKFARFAATLGMIGGVKAFTTASLGSALVADVEEKDWDNWVKDTVMFGLPGAAGVDISESLGLRIFPTAPGAPQDTQRFFREMLGPSGSAVSETLFSGVFQEASRLISTGESPDPEIMKKFYRTMLKNMPAGVAVDRVISADDVLRGRRDRIQVDETPKDRALRALFGARSTTVSKGRELQNFLRDKDEETNRRSRLIKDDVINRLADIREGRWSILESVEKFGGKLENVTLDSIGDDIVKKEMPNLVREFDTLTQADKRDVFTNNPKLFKLINAERTKGAKRLHEWLNK